MSDRSRLDASAADCETQLCGLQADAFRGLRLLLDLPAPRLPDECEQALLTNRLHRDFAVDIQQCVIQAEHRLKTLIEATLAITPASETETIAFLQQEMERIEAACTQFQQALRQVQANGGSVDDVSFKN